MAKVFLDDTILSDIADAIREKTGTTDKIVVSDMSNKLSNMNGGIDSGLLDIISGTAATIDNKYLNGITKIGSRAFSDWVRLTSIEIPDSVISIGEYAFNGCTSLTSINLPDGITNIDNGTFNNCTRLTSIEIPDSVTSIGDSAFNNCTRLTSINLPDGIISIGTIAFSGCTSLTSINLPDSVVSIGANAFKNCTGLTSIEIPAGISSMNNIFIACTSLKMVIFKGKPTTLSSSVFYDCKQSDLIINVPWAEGEVANAPWGATKATINYNYTGE